MSFLATKIKWNYSTNITVLNNSCNKLTFKQKEIKTVQDNFYSGKYMWTHPSHIIMTDH